MTLLKLKKLPCVTVIMTSKIKLEAQNIEIRINQNLCDASLMRSRVQIVCWRQVMAPCLYVAGSR